MASDLKDILSKSPHIDLEAVGRNLELLRILRSQGIVPRPKLLSPFERRRVRLMDDLSSDPRVVRLRSLGPAR